MHSKWNSTELRHHLARKQRGIITSIQIWGKTDCWCQLWKSVRAWQGTPQPWQSEPWEPGARGKNLFICVVPHWDGQSLLQQSSCNGHTCLQRAGHPQRCTFDQFHIHRSDGLNINWFVDFFSFFTLFHSDSPLVGKLVSDPFRGMFNFSYLRKTLSTGNLEMLFSEQIS